MKQLEQSPWKCVGCGAVSIARERTCKCPTNVLHRDQNGRSTTAWKDDVAGNAGLSHADLCRLSRAFNQTAQLDDPQDYRINEWLKLQISEVAL